MEIPKCYENENDFPLCRDADLKIIKDTIVNNEDLKYLDLLLNKYLEKGENINPTLFKLLDNYVSKNKLENVEHIYGVKNLTYIKLEKYNKYIILAGERHEELKEEKNAVTISKYFEEYLQCNTNLIDMFLEIPVEEDENIELKNSELTNFINQFRECVEVQNCSARIHKTDIRSINIPFLVNLIYLSDCIEQLYQDNSSIKLSKEYINIILKIISQYKTLEDYTKIELYPYLGININKDSIKDENIKNYILQYYDSIKTEIYFEQYLEYLDRPYEKLKKKIPIIIDDIYNYLNKLIDIYTTIIIFKSYDKGYNPDPKYIFIFQGQKHINRLKHFFTTLNSTEVVYDLESDDNMIDIRNIPQPFFHDVMYKP
jgi:hypothetical protein